jgi:hypothetical protein
MNAMKPMQPMTPMEPMKPMEPLHGSATGAAGRWWPEDLGTSPSTSGGQNEVRYAYFADQDRLVVDDGSGRTTVYDSAGHRVSGVQQRQSGGAKKLVFSGPDGEMDLETLRRVS